MRNVPILTLLGALGAALVASSALADDVHGASALLCAPLRASVCWQDADCAALPPADLNLPRFVQVDVDGKQLRTTPASGENRVTPIRSIGRGDGLVTLQGEENGRAWSLVIAEDTGDATFVSALAGRAVAVFATCTVAGPR